MPLPRFVKVLLGTQDRVSPIFDVQIFEDEETQTMVGEIQLLRAEYEYLRSTIEVTDSIMQSLLTMNGGYFWAKDLNAKYLWCTPQYASDFFELDSYLDMRGHTHREITDSYEKRTGKVTTFAGGCTYSDRFCLSSGATCRFIEIGCVGDAQYIMDITKQPFEYGLACFGIDQTHIYTEESLQKAESKGNIQRIFTCSHGLNIVYKVNTIVLKFTDTMKLSKDILEDLVMERR